MAGIAQDMERFESPHGVAAAATTGAAGAADAADGTAVARSRRWRLARRSAIFSSAWAAADSGSASTIGANRAGRSAVRELLRTLGADAAA